MTHVNPGTQVRPPPNGAAPAFKGKVGDYGDFVMQKVVFPTAVGNAAQMSARLIGCNANVGPSDWRPIWMTMGPAALWMTVP